MNEAQYVALINDTIDDINERFRDAYRAMVNSEIRFAALQSLVIEKGIVSEAEFNDRVPAITPIFDQAVAAQAEQEDAGP